MIIPPQFFLEIETFQTKVIEKIERHFMVNSSFFSKIVPFMRYVEKYVTARQATDDNIIMDMRFACWTTKAIDTHLEYVILLSSLRQ